MVTGYKCFNTGLVSRYGDKYEVGTKYHASGKIKFNSNGFHMCANLEDTLRYFDAISEDVEIAKVIGYGDIDYYDDEYNDFYDMYATEYMEIIHVLTRDEIIDYALNLGPLQVERFLSLYKLTKDEIELFKEKFNIPIILMAIEYYQENNSKAYQKIK